MNNSENSHKLAPIALFVYNRLNHLKKTIESLQNNELASSSQLFIFSDAAKNAEAIKKVNAVRDYIKTIGVFKKITIIERDCNYGLAKSIIDGVTQVLNEYGKIIVLEDDLVTSPYFLKFMNEALKMYQYEPRVASIHGYIYPIDNLPETFFIRGADCWGWATWNDRWSIFESDGQKLLIEIKNRNIQKEIDFNGSYEYTKMLQNFIKGKNNSWAVRWYVSAFLKNMLTLYPGKSYVQNIGHDAEATHTKRIRNLFDVDLNHEFKLSKIDINENSISRKKIENFFRKAKRPSIKKIFEKISNFFYEKIN